MLNYISLNLNVNILWIRVKTLEVVTNPKMVMIYKVIAKLNPNQTKIPQKHPMDNWNQ